MFARFYVLPRWLRDIAPLILWMAFIFILSSRSTLLEIESGTGEKLFNKSAHVIVYGILAWLWWRALTLQRQITWPILLTALTLTVLYGISDEYHQSFVPGRHSRVSDVLFDASGALAMILFIRYTQRIVERNGFNQRVKERNGFNQRVKEGNGFNQRVEERNG
jgi:VanZ family protein